MFEAGIVLVAWSAVEGMVALTSILGGAAFWVALHTHRRLRNLEEQSGERRTVIFGNDDNPLHIGLTKEVAALKEELDELKEEVDDASGDREELKRRIIRVEEKIERVLDELEGQ